VVVPLNGVIVGRYACTGALIQVFGKDNTGICATHENPVLPE
jgi:hypothetical protein